MTVRIQTALWDAGNWCNMAGVRYPRLRPFWWLLGRFFIRRSRVRWEDICQTVDDEIEDGLDDELGRGTTRQ